MLCARQLKYRERTPVLGRRAWSRRDDSPLTSSGATVESGCRSVGVWLKVSRKFSGGGRRGQSQYPVAGPILRDWCDIYRDVRRREDPLQSPGCRLANLVARHAVAVFAARRKALRMDAGFAVRVRDSGGPLPVARAGHSLFTVMYLTLWPTSITDESTGSAHHGPSVDLSSPML